MPRLFVAIDLEKPVLQRLAELKTDLPTARWTRPEQMHLTLRFIGAEVAPALVQPIKSALADIRAAPFSLTLKGVGRFPVQKRKPPSVLWVGIEPVPELKALHAAIESALVPLGFAPEDRDFSPHITLARFKTHRGLPELEEFIQAHADFDAGTSSIQEFVLYSSILKPQGAEYRREARYPLT